ncbi:LacI family DNA-binding transcriptional regulator [Sphingomonas sp. M6A6_1c]
MRKSGQPTINDVARIAGVSKKTVSRVINRSPLLHADTRARVEQVIGDLGYIPNPQARALALRRNFLIGLVHDNPNAQTVMNVQHGLLAGLRGTEFELVVRPVDRASPTMLEDLRHFLERQRLFGVLLMPPISEDDGVARLCAAIGCRYVRMGSAMLDVPAQMVASDDRTAVREAAACLVAHGHRRIGFIGGPAGFRSAHERRAGFDAALAAAGLDLPDDRVAEGHYTFESGLAAAERLLDADPRPTAIFAANDEMAAGVVHAARRRGLVMPDDLSIIGFDDTPIAAHLWPPLTTVRWPSMAMAHAAARKLIGEDGDQPAHFPSTLIHRASVAAPPSIPPPPGGGGSPQR